MESKTFNNTTPGRMYWSNEGTITKGKANFVEIPFHDANIDYKREESSTLTFKSPLNLTHGGRIRYEGAYRNFGGQIWKVKNPSNGDKTYEVISYTNIYQKRKTSGWIQKITSSQILKELLEKYTTSEGSSIKIDSSGIEDTTFVHKSLKWSNTSLWDIALQLKWLEEEAGNYIDCYVDVDGVLHFQKKSKTAQ